nr:LysR family transcriptional regulator [uncultured Cupriavidus sp.]
MRDFDLTTLRLFVAAYENQNIARAAEQSHVVASGVSKRLAQLEDSVGAKLFERGRRGVIPTAAGEVLLAHARGLIAAADRAARDLADFGSGIRGHVRLIATVSSMAESLPQDIASFLRVPEHRDIAVTVDEGLSNDIVQALREGTVPLGICWNAAGLEGFQTRPYRSDHLAAVVPVGHPLASGSRCTFEQTLAFDHVGMPAQSAIQALLGRQAAILGKRMLYRAVVSTFDGALRCVQANLGICIIPAETVLPIAGAFGTKVIPLNDDWATRGFSLCFRNFNSLSPAARLLVGHLSRQGDVAGES